MLAMAKRSRDIAFDRAVVLMDILRLFFSDIDLERLQLTVVDEKEVRIGDQIIPLQLLKIRRPPRLTIEVWAVVFSIDGDEWQQAFVYADPAGTFCSLIPTSPGAVVLK